MKKPRQVDIWTDGGCKQNPGNGGFAALLDYRDNRKKIITDGCFIKTTNNRMELMAVVEALSLFSTPHTVNIFSDSRYVIDSITNDNVLKWKRNNWRTKNKKIRNVDLWSRIVPMLSFHKIHCYWVKGHSGFEYNELCDKLATEAYCQFTQKVDIGYRNRS